MINKTNCNHKSLQECNGSITVNYFVGRLNYEQKKHEIAQKFRRNQINTDENSSNHNKKQNTNGRVGAVLYKGQPLRQ